MSENTEKKPDKPEDEELSEDELDGVSGGAGVAARLDPSKTKLKSSGIKNPLVNVGMEKNDAEELPVGAINTTQTSK